MAVYDPRLANQVDATYRPRSVQTYDDVLARMSELQYQARAAGVPTVAPSATTIPSPGGWKGLVANALNFAPVKYGLVKPLEALSVPKNFVIGGLDEVADALDRNPETSWAWDDWWDKATDPTYGFGTAAGDLTGNKWVNRAIGFVGDVALDPLMYLNTGARIAGSAAGQVGRRASIETTDFAGKQLLASRSYEVMLAAGDSPAAAGAKAQEIIRRGAGAARQLLTAEQAAEVGLNRSGLYLFRGKVLPSYRIPFTGAMGDFLANRMTNTRLRFTSTKIGRKLQEMTMAGEDTIAAARLALARGEVPADQVGMRLVMVSALDPKRAAESAARTFANDAFQRINSTSGVSNDDVLAKEITRLMESPEELANVAPRTRDAAVSMRGFLDDSFTQLDEAFRAVDVAAGKDVTTRVGYQRNYVPHLTTPAARDELIRNPQKYAETIEALGIKELNPQTFTYPRRLEEGSVFFGRELSKSDLTIARLNQIANEGGFVGEFFETDIRKILTAYARDWSEQMGNMAAFRHLQDYGLLSVVEESLEATPEAMRKAVNAASKDLKSFDVRLQKFGKAGENLSEAFDDLSKAIDTQLGKATADVVAQVSARNTSLASIAETFWKALAGHRAALKELETAKEALFGIQQSRSAVQEAFQAQVDESLSLWSAATDDLERFVEEVTGPFAATRYVVETRLRSAQDSLDAAKRAAADAKAVLTRHQSKIAWIEENWDALLSGQTVKGIGDNPEREFLQRLGLADGLIPEETLGRLQSQRFVAGTQTSWEKNVTELFKGGAAKGEAASADERFVYELFGPGVSQQQMAKSFDEAYEAYSRQVAIGGNASAWRDAAAMVAQSLRIYGSLDNVPPIARVGLMDAKDAIVRLRTLHAFDDIVATASRQDPELLEASFTKLKELSDDLGELFDEVRLLEARHLDLHDKYVDMPITSFKEFGERAEVLAEIQRIDVRLADLYQREVSLRPTARQASIEAQMERLGGAETDVTILNQSATVGQMVRWAVFDYVESSPTKRVFELGQRARQKLADGENALFAGGVEQRLDELKRIIAESDEFLAYKKAPYERATYGGSRQDLIDDLARVERKAELTEGKIPGATARSAAERALQPGRRPRTRGKVTVKTEGALSAKSWGAKAQKGSTQTFEDLVPVLGQTSAQERADLLLRLEAWTSSERLGRSYQIIAELFDDAGLRLPTDGTGRIFRELVSRQYGPRVSSWAGRMSEAGDRLTRIDGIVADTAERLSRARQGVLSLNEPAEYSAAAERIAKELGRMSGDNAGDATFALARSYREAKRAAAATNVSPQKRVALDKALKAEEKKVSAWFKALRPDRARFKFSEAESALSMYGVDVVDARSYQRFVSVMRQHAQEQYDYARRAYRMVQREQSNANPRVGLERYAKDLEDKLNTIERLQREIPEYSAKLERAAQRTQETLAREQRAFETYSLFRSSYRYTDAKRREAEFVLLRDLAGTRWDAVSAEEWASLGVRDLGSWDPKWSAENARRFSEASENGTKRLFVQDETSGVFRMVRDPSTLPPSTTVYQLADRAPSPELLAGEPNAYVANLMNPREPGYIPVYSTPVRPGPNPRSMVSFSQAEQEALYTHAFKTEAEVAEIMKGLRSEESQILLKMRDFQRAYGARPRQIPRGGEAVLDVYRQELLAVRAKIAGANSEVLKSARRKLNRIIANMEKQDPNFLNSEPWKALLGMSPDPRHVVSAAVRQGREEQLAALWKGSEQAKYLSSLEETLSKAKLAEGGLPLTVSEARRRLRNVQTQIAALGDSEAERLSRQIASIERSSVGFRGRRGDLEALSRTLAEGRDVVATVQPRIVEPARQAADARIAAQSTYDELLALKRQGDAVAPRIRAAEDEIRKRVNDLAKEMDRNSASASKLAKPSQEEKQAASRVSKAATEEAKSRKAVADAVAAFDQKKAISPSEAAAVERLEVAQRGQQIVRDLLTRFDRERLSGAVARRRELYTKTGDLLIEEGGKEVRRSISVVRETIRKGQVAQETLDRGWEEVAKGNRVIRKALTSEKRVKLENAVERGRLYQEALDAAQITDDEMSALLVVAEQLRAAPEVFADLAKVAPREAKALEAITTSYLNAHVAMSTARSASDASTAVLLDPTSISTWVKQVEDGFSALEDWGLPGLKTNVAVKEFFDNFKRMEQPEIAKAMSKFLGWYSPRFKAYALATPGFHVRNAIDNTFRVFSAGAELKNMFEGARLYDDWIKARRAGNLEAFMGSLGSSRERFESALRIFNASGSGQQQGALADVLGAFKQSKIDNNWWLRKHASWSERVEGSARFMLAFDSVAQGMDFQQGANRVRRYLFDYAPEGRSRLDRNLAQIIPFWTYMSKNFPFQIVNRWQNPKAYILLNNALTAATGGPLSELPQYLQSAGAVNLGDGNVLSIDVGQNKIGEQLSLLGDPSRLLKDVNPALRVPLEMFADRRFYNNRPFSDRDSQIPGGTVGQPLAEALLSLLGKTSQGADGETVTSSRAAYALTGLVPPLALSERLDPSTDVYKSNQQNAWLGFLGLPYRKLSQEQLDAEKARQLEELRKLLRSQG